MDIIQVARAGLSIKKLTAEHVLAVLSRLEIRAAEESIRKGHLAHDMRATVQSAITHLETAEAACINRTQFKKGTAIVGDYGIMSTDSAFRFHEVRYNFFLLLYIHAAMCILYYSLGENRLVLYTIKKMKSTEAKLIEFLNISDLSAPGNFINPANWRYLNKKLPFSPEEYDNFLSAVATWNIDFEDASTIQRTPRNKETLMIGSNPDKGDARVRRALEQLNCPYSILDDGDFKIQVSLNEGRSQVVFVKSEISAFRNIEIREVYSVGYVEESNVDAATMKFLLTENSTLKFGSWQITEGNNGRFLIMFVVHTSPTVDAKTLDSIIDFVAERADNFEKETHGSDKY